MLHSLKRQWKFLSESQQRPQAIKIALVSIGVASLLTCKGVEWGKYYADVLKLKDHKRTAFVVGGGVTGFTIGIGLGVIGQAYQVEHSERLRKWKKQNINKAVEELIKQEFEQDLIWAQLLCPIGLAPMFMPVRAPTGVVCDYKQLIKCTDQDGFIKDIYNKKINSPSAEDPNHEIDIHFHISSTVSDEEMMVVIYKRFRHFTNVKLKEEGLSPSTQQFFSDYKDALASFITPIYLKLEGEIISKKNLAQSEASSSEEIALKAEEIYEEDLKTFKKLFGKSTLSDIDWGMEIDWLEILNQRWMAKHHS